MTDFENTYYYQLARAQLNLNKMKQENEMLKTTAGMTAPMAAYNFLPPERIENIGPSYLFSECFEPLRVSEDNDYQRGYINGWVDCADYFIKNKNIGDEPL